MNFSIIILLTLSATPFALKMTSLFSEVDEGPSHPAWERVAKKRAQDIQSLPHQSIIFFGDSLVEHWSGEVLGNKTEEHRNRPKIWRKFFTERYGPSHVSGISGDTSTELLERLKHGESPTKQANPDLIMVHIGTNDLSYNTRFVLKQAKAKIVKDYKQIIHVLHEASPNSQILLTSIFPKGTFWNSEKHLYKLAITETNANIASLANKPWIHFADCGHTILKHGRVSQRLSPDYVHQTDEGAKAWAECLQATIDKILPH